MSSTELEVHDEPLDADGKTGVVRVELPGGGCLVLTREAAEQTSLRLLEAATVARLPDRYR